MPNLTLSIPKSLDEKMKKYSELKWTQIIRDLIKRKLKELDDADYRLYSLSRLTKVEGAEELFEF